MSAIESEQAVGRPRLFPPSDWELKRLERLADLLDKKYLDPILGMLLPGVGDAAGSLMGLYTVYVAWRIGIHPVTLARMLMNLGVDALLGAVPVLGWIADFFYKAHVRNLRLLKRRLGLDEAQPLDAARSPSVENGLSHDPSPTDYVILCLAGAFLALALLLPAIFLVLFFRWIVSFF